MLLDDGHALQQYPVYLFLTGHPNLLKAHRLYHQDRPSRRIGFRPRCLSARGRDRPQVASVELEAGDHGEVVGGRVGHLRYLCAEQLQALAVEDVVQASVGFVRGEGEPRTLIGCIDVCETTSRMPSPRSSPMVLSDDMSVSGSSSKARRTNFRRRTVHITEQQTQWTGILQEGRCLRACSSRFLSSKASR